MQEVVQVRREGKNATGAAIGAPLGDSLGGPDGEKKNAGHPPRNKRCYWHKRREGGYVSHKQYPSATKSRTRNGSE